MNRRITIKDPQREVATYTRRILVSAVVILAGAGLLIGRYFELQILHYSDYATRSDRNRIHVQSVAPTRGLIFDRNGNLLADNRPSYMLAIVKERVKNLNATLADLRSLLGLDDDDIKAFRERLGNRRPYEPVPLKFDLSEAEIARIAVNSYRLPGVEVKAELKRYYPYGEIYAHVLGYVGSINERELRSVDPVNYAGTHTIGKTGLEKYYESWLHGKVGSENVETNARGRVLRVLDRTDPVPGHDLILYLDTAVQRAAFKAMGSHRGAVVAIDPNTGGVIAMVSTPSFDPNLFVGGISPAKYRELSRSHDLPLFNRAVLGQYPPGSTIKPIFGLAGLQYGVITPQFAINDPGWFQLPNDTRYYRDWKKWGHGPHVDLHEAIVQSCDTYFYELAYHLGIDRMHAFASKFGLGRPTGIDLAHERSGLLPSRQWKEHYKRMPWFPGETLSAGIGQGYVLVTPLQLAVATAAIASRGELVTPRLLKSVSGELPEPPHREPIELKNPEYWNDVINAMADVVHSIHGTAHRIDRGLKYTMAGKTGTAQVIGISRTEGYNPEEIAKHNRDHALFIAFAPVDHPEIAVAVVVENGEHGASTAAPVARKVIDTYLLGQDKTAKTRSDRAPH